MLQLRGELPDVMGAKFEAAINRITERMRPAKGQSWDLPERRRADALLELCEAWEAGPAGPQLSQPLLVVEVPESGPSEVVGIPLPDAMVEQLRATASIEPVLVDHAGVPSSIGKRSSGLSPKVARAVLLRDGHCRCESECDVTYGLHVHHIRPSSWGGSDDPSNLIAITASHHPPLVPNGPWALVGNPNRPDGMRRVHISQLTADEAEQLGLPPPRAGPNVAQPHSFPSV